MPTIEPKKILVIEDDEDTAEAIQAMLEVYGFKVRTKFCPVDGMDELQKSHYDAIVVDYLMPKMNGVEVISKSRSEKNIPAILLTGFGNTDIKAESSDAGAYAYLEKPVAPKALADIVTEAISSRV